MRPIRNLAADRAAILNRAAQQVRAHRAIARVVAVSIALLLVGGLARQGATQAGPPSTPSAPISILPANVGEAVSTTTSITIRFDAPVDTASVADLLEVRPAASIELSWSADGDELELIPSGRWRTDTRYLVTVPGEALLADGTPIGRTLRNAFTTQTAPAVLEFMVSPAGTDARSMAAGWTATVKEQQGGPVTIDSSTTHASTTDGTGQTAADVSGLTQLSIRFSGAMHHASVVDAFAITPEVAGTFTWVGTLLTFRPSARLDPDTRYTVSLVGARDRLGNAVRDDAVFSFTTRPQAQLVKIQPVGGARDVTSQTVTLWFSQPMDGAAVADAFAVVDLTVDRSVPGSLSWNETGTVATFAPDAPLPQGHLFETRLAAGAADADQNPVAGAWRFTTKAAPPPPPRAPTSAPAPPTVPAPAPSTDLATYALNQVNAARAAYGFAPLRLDPAISAVAAAHAWDQVRNGYFSHYGLDGSTVKDRLRRGGVSFSSAGENQCWNGSHKTQRQALDWCHAVFMAEPYPGYANHIGNILSPRFTRMGIGIAEGGGRIILTWNFAG